MKKTLLLLFIGLSLAISLKAQVRKDAWMVGGNFTTGLVNLDDADYIISILPNTGYFITDRIPIIVNLGFSAVFGAGTNESLGLGARYYLGNTEETLLPYFRVGTTFLNGTTIGGGVGLDLFITPNVALEGNLDVTRFIENSDFDQSSTNVGLQFGFQVFLNNQDK